MKSWLVVFLKEVRENLRDKRAVAAALLLAPLMGPVIFAAILSFVTHKQKEEFSKLLEVPVLNAEAAPNLVAYLAQNRIKAIAAPADAEASIRAQQYEVVLRIAPDFGARWQDSEPARLDLIYDGSRQQAMLQVQRLRGVLEQYSQRTGRLRLMARGLDGSVLSALNLVDQDLATPESRAAMFLAMLPYLLILSAFVGSMYLAIDVTSGERERQSLEALLLNPASRTQIMLGKQLAAALFAFAAQGLQILAMATCFKLVPSDSLGLELGISPRVGFAMLLIAAPIAVLAASSQVLMACFAKTFREAQTYQSFLLIIPIVPTMVMVLNPMKPELWMYATPILGQSVLILELMRGEALHILGLVLNSVVTLLLSLGLGYAAARFFGREKALVAG